MSDFSTLVTAIRAALELHGLKVAPSAWKFIDRDWGIPPETRNAAMTEITAAIRAGAPERCREPDRVKFSGAGVVVFVALAQPQPDVREAMLVRAVKERSK